MHVDVLRLVRKLLSMLRSVDRSVVVVQSLKLTHFIPLTVDDVADI